MADSSKELFDSQCPYSKDEGCARWSHRALTFRDTEKDSMVWAMVRPSVIFQVVSDHQGRVSVSTLRPRGTAKLDEEDRFKGCLARQVACNNWKLSSSGFVNIAGSSAEGSSGHATTFPLASKAAIRAAIKTAFDKIIEAADEEEGGKDLAADSRTLLEQHLDAITTRIIANTDKLTGPGSARQQAQPSGSIFSTLWGLVGK